VTACQAAAPIGQSIHRTSEDRVFRAIFNGDVGWLPPLVALLSLCAV
jgi:hypothetical protein